MSCEPSRSSITLIYAKVRDPESRSQLLNQLVNLPGERISGTLFEIYTADWDDGLWEQELELMLRYIDEGSDTFIFWRTTNGELTRTCIAGRLA